LLPELLRHSPGPFPANEHHRAARELFCAVPEMPRGMSSSKPEHGDGRTALSHRISSAFPQQRRQA